MLAFSSRIFTLDSLDRFVKALKKMDSERQVLPVEHEAITSGDNDSALGDIEVLVAFEIFEILHFLKTKISVST